MHIEPASPGVGAIATGVDLNRLEPSDWQALYDAWLDAGVLIVRGQDLDIDGFLGYGRRFGDIQPHPVEKTRHPDYPELTVMGEARKKDGSLDQTIRTRGQSWHTDGPWDHRVCKATQLYGLAIPSVGGDTLFANMYMAYDALPAELKARIKDLDAHYVYGGRARKSAELLPPEKRDMPPTRYPLTRTHAETGRTSLFFNPTHILKIAGVDDATSDALIEELTAHMVAPGADYRHQWRVGDVVTWDNRCTLHSATGGCPADEDRIHWRCTIMAN